MAVYKKYSLFHFYRKSSRKSDIVQSKCFLESPIQIRPCGFLFRLEATFLIIKEISFELVQIQFHIRDPVGVKKLALKYLLTKKFPHVFVYIGKTPLGTQLCVWNYWHENLEQSTNTACWQDWDSLSVMVVNLIWRSYLHVSWCINAMIKLTYKLEITLPLKNYERLFQLLQMH